jgi:hypothetical protein
MGLAVHAWLQAGRAMPISLCAGIRLETPSGVVCEVGPTLGGAEPLCMGALFVLASFIAFITYVRAP